MKFLIYTFGCTQNLKESQDIISLLENSSFVQTKKIDESDLVLINSCGVKDHTEAKIITLIKKLINARNDKKLAFKIIVFGCLTEISRERLKEFSKDVTFLGVKPVDDLIKILSLQSPPSKELRQELKRGSRKGFIKIISISSGCLSNCTYCATKFARGNLKSRTIEDINEDFKDAIDRGYKEIYLTSTDCGCYGLDISENIVSLLKKLLSNSSKRSFDCSEFLANSQKGDYKIRLGMMNFQYVKEFKKDFSEIFKNENLFRFIHLPLQSGSNRILKLMGRMYSVEEFLAFVNHLREKIPDLTISTDIIVGFPTETDEDFEATEQAVENLQPDVVNVSKFSYRPRISANNLAPKVPGKMISRRSKEISELCSEFAFKRNRLMEGKHERIFISENKKGNFSGRTANYKQTFVGNAVFGKYANVKIVRGSNRSLKAELIKDKSF